jgi:Na+-driven multidrug efflux pump
MLFVAVEHLGQRELAIANIVRSVYVVLLIPINALSTVTNTFVSNCIGAGHREEVIPVIRKITWITLSVVSLFVLLSCLFPSGILAIYTNDMTLVQASIPSLYVICGALVVASVANIVFNGVTGTGNTRSAFAIEIGTLVFYSLFIYVAGMRLYLPVAVCFLSEFIYYVGLLVASVIYLKKASWQNKKI